MTEPTWVRVVGRGIYETLAMPVVPCKGDILWLRSLTHGKPVPPEVLVSKVEWAMDQAEGTIHAWLTVRRVNGSATAKGRRDDE